jgi:hypothetical protein
MLAQHHLLPVWQHLLYRATHASMQRDTWHNTCAVRNLALL